MALIECSGCGEELDLDISDPRGVAQIAHSDGTVSILQSDDVVHRCEERRAQSWHQLPVAFLAASGSLRGEHGVHFGNALD
jgi:hypothetical protein